MAGVLCSMVGATFTVAAAAEIIRAKKSLVAIGNAQVDTAQSQFGGASLLCDGTGDYLLSENNGNYNFGTSSFTIEFWIRFNVAPTLYVPIALRPGGAIENGEWWCEITNAEKKMYWGFKNQAGTQFYVNLALAGTAFVTGQWYHIALVNNAGTAQMYINGTATGTSTALSGSFGNSTTPLWVGAGAGSYSLNGWLDEIRISNSARYTSNFTPATAPFVNDNNTLLLIHADGTDASTYFDDDNGVRAQVGLTSNSVTVSTAQSQFGGSSAFFDGTGTDHISAVNAPNLGTGNFTVEFWLRNVTNPNGTTNGVINKRRVDDVAAGSWGIRWTDNGSSRTMVWQNIISGNTTEIVSTSNVWSYNTWSHWAFVRNSGTLTIYHNGTSVGSAANSVNYTNTEPLRIGWWGTGSVCTNSFIDEVRISNNARYTANFTAPTASFVNDSNTLLLMHMHQANGSTIFVDDNTGTVTTEDTYTVPTTAFVNDPSTIVLYQFENNGTDSSSNGWNFTTNGGFSSAQSRFGTFSGDLTDSTSDFFTHATDRAFGPYNGTFYTDWTLEGYFYYTSWTGASQDFNGTPLPNALIVGDVGGNGAPLWFGFGATGSGHEGRLRVLWNNIGSAGGTTVANLNTWNHIALTFNAKTGIIKGYLNGVKEFTLGPALPHTSINHFTVGGANVGNSSCFVDSVRISRNLRYGI